MGAFRICGLNCLVVLAGVCGVTRADGFTLDLTPSGLTRFLGAPFSLDTSGDVAATRNALISATRTWATKQLSAIDEVGGRWVGTPHGRAPGGWW